MYMYTLTIHIYNIDKNLSVLCNTSGYTNGYIENKMSLFNRIENVIKPSELHIYT